MDSSRRRFLRLGVGATLGGGVAVSVGGSLYNAYAHPDQRDSPSALVAGSLLSVAEDVPGASIEAHGSVTARQFVIDGIRNPDVLALADPLLFRGLTETMTLFATNALCLAYNPDSAHAEAIHSDWSLALLNEDVSVGRTDPETDPLGYRTVLALELAERFGIAQREILDNSLVFPETLLLRNVEAGAVDAAFVYRSMAEEHEIPYIDLPMRIDFSSPEYAKTYASVELELEDRTVRGAPIRYAAATLTPAGNDWLTKLVTGTERLRNHGFTVPSQYPLQRTVESNYGTDESRASR